jgi:hypothetical protein
LVSKDKNTKIILVGHSIGAYINNAVYEKIKYKDNILAIYQVFPTILDMKVTPNGIKLSKLFNT